MPLYEIVNPSDPYTMHAKDATIASAAVLLIGMGSFGLRGPDVKRQPLMLFMSESQGEAFLVELFGPGSLSAYIDANLEPLAEALESVMLVGPDERPAYDSAIARLPEAERAAYRKTVYDRRRTSLSRIGEDAWMTAHSIRALIAEKAAPSVDGRPGPRGEGRG